jgi:DME family drug/metabolite transporter
VSPAGVLLCLLAGASYASYALVNQRLVSTAAPAAVTTTVFTLAAALAVPGAAALAGPLQFHAADAGLVLWLGVVSTGVAYLLFSHALRHISAATGVVVALAEPVTAFVLAIAVVGERPGWIAAFGLAAVLAGLWVVVGSELTARTVDPGAGKRSPSAT